MEKMPAKRYQELAARLLEARSTLGLTQAELAAELGFKQQAVSRWEAASHRPTVDQIPSLAAILGTDSSELMALAGYGRTPANSVASLFPVDALDPETFERFVEMLVAESWPDADVNIQGMRGHKQLGTDVVASFADGKRWSFQCKRVDRFGPADIEAAVAAHTIQADRKFLVLGKVATPASINALAAHRGWTLWDKQVLSRKLRSLPMDAQERIVDIFFRGQRMALLGREEPGPWLTTGEYFAPFKGRSALFSHDWSLVGRSPELDALKDALGAVDNRFILLTGPGGTGKTRILKEAINQFEKAFPGTMIRFLSTSQDADTSSLARLGKRRKLLVVDDAHDREGLKLLVEYALNPANDARLLVAARPYAEQRIRNEFAHYGIVEPVAVTLGRLDRASLRGLVLEVLDQFDGPHEAVDDIIAAASDSPLVAAMAARVVAVEGIAPGLARGEVKLRRYILSRFTDVVAGQLGTSADAPILRAILEVIALLQPFHVEDRRIAELVALNRPGTAESDAMRGLKLLVEGGVLYRRGALFRLMPDLLGDFLIEDRCVGIDGKLADFVVEMAATLEGDRLAHLLVNLGRADWRLTDGDTSNSQLLDPIWRQLRTIDNEFDGRVGAVEAVAIYQPTQALDFVQAQISEGRIFSSFGKTLERVAYSSEQRHDALQLLWELGQADTSPLNSNPGHAIRLLSELIGYDEFKPVGFNKEVAEFGFALLDDPTAWNQRFTPFDILKSLLSGEGVTTRSTGRGITMTPFFIDYDVVKGLRGRVIDRMIDLLQSSDDRIAIAAAHLVSEAVQPPHGSFGTHLPEELSKKYDKEFAATITRLDQLVANGTLASTTLIVLVRSLDWYAQYGAGPLHTKVRRLFAKLPSSLEFRLRASVTDSASWDFTGQVPVDEWSSETEWLPGFVANLLVTYPDRHALCDAIMQAVDAVESAGISGSASFDLVSRLVEIDPTFGSVIIDRSLADPAGRECNHLGQAVGAILRREPDEGRKMVRAMIASDAPQIRSGGVRSLIGLKNTDDDFIALIREVLQSDDAAVVRVGITVLRAHRELDQRQLLALIECIEFGADPNLFEHVATILCMHRPKIWDKLRFRDVRSLLKRMVPLPSIQGHWVHELLVELGKHRGLLIATFILERLTIQIAQPDGGRGGHYNALLRMGRDAGLGLENSPDAEMVLEAIWKWLRVLAPDKGPARYFIAQAIVAMVKPQSDTVAAFFERKLEGASVRDLEWIGEVLSYSHYSLALKQHRFVERYLDRCRAVGTGLLKDAISNIGSSAMTGQWSGSVGEPTSRDVQTRDAAQSIISTMSRFSAAYGLYDDILKNAKRRIQDSLAEGAMLDDEHS